MSTETTEEAVPRSLYETIRAAYRAKNDETPTKTRIAKAVWKWVQENRPKEIAAEPEFDADGNLTGASISEKDAKKIAEDALSVDSEVAETPPTEEKAEPEVDPLAADPTTEEVAEPAEEEAKETEVEESKSEETEK